MRKILIAVMIPLLFACSAKEIDDNKDKEQILKTYKTELKDLKLKISEIEKELREDDDSQDRILIKVKEIKPQVFEHYIQLTGNVEADKNITIKPEMSGNIISILVTEGEYVNKGKVLAKLNVDQLLRQRDELITKLELQTIIFERQQRLWNQKIGSEIEFLKVKNNKESLEKNLETMKAQISKASVVAPFSGYVDEIFQKRGEMAGPSIPFIQLVNIKNVYVEADVPENYLLSIKAGSETSLSFPAINYKTKAKIHRASKIINSANRSFTIRINLNNPNQIIKPNLLSTVKICDYKNESAIVVPSLVIKKDFEGNYLYVLSSDKSKANKVYVEVAHSYNNSAMIVKGLVSGDYIITEGFAQVVNGSLVSIQ